MEACNKACQKCDIGYVLKNYVKPLMQTLTIDIKDFYMKLLTTKCLNTAVMLSIFMLGRKRGLDIAGYCDTVKTRKRHMENIDSTHVILSSFRDDFLVHATRNREFYYILLTDGSFPYEGTSKPPAFFPGHVFILEKIPTDDGPIFYMYQSYINKYDFKEHIKKNHGTLKISPKRAVSIADTLEYILQADTWDAECVKLWKKMTFVDTTDIMGSSCKNRFFLCIRKAPVKDCLKHIQQYTEQKLKEIEKIPDAHLCMKIYGDTSLYDKSQKPLTVSEMYRQLKSLHKDVTQKKVSLSSIK